MATSRAGRGSIRDRRVRRGRRAFRAGKAGGRIALDAGAAEIQLKAGDRTIELPIIAGMTAIDGTLEARTDDACERRKSPGIAVFVFSPAIAAVNAEIKSRP